MSVRPILQLILFCCVCPATLTSGYTTENIFGTDGDDVLFGTTGDDEIVGSDGNDLLTGHDGNDILRGGNGDDVLRGGNGDDVLYGGPGIDRFYGGPGADRFVIFMDDLETDEVMDFSPEQKDSVFLHHKYIDDGSSTEAGDINAEGIRIDEDGDVEVRLNHSDWTRVISLHEKNLDLNSQELTGGILLTFTRRF